MSIERARILKGVFTNAASAEGATAAIDHRAALAERRRIDAEAGAVRARRVAAEEIEARERAARILADADARAAVIVESAATAAAAEAREAEVAKLAAGFLALRAEEERRAERDLDRVVELAKLLAERLVGEALRVEPARVAALAASALHETRGARRVRIDACPEDIEALKDALATIGPTVDVHEDPKLARGSLVVHTDLGHVDARLEPQLARLAAALREVLR